MMPSGFEIGVLLFALLMVLSLASAAKHRNRRRARDEAKRSAVAPPDRLDL